MLGNGMAASTGSYVGEAIKSVSELQHLRERVEKNSAAIAEVARELCLIAERTYGATPENDKAQGVPPSAGTMQGIHTALSAQESVIQFLQTQVNRFASL
jgi:hypothetical protein